ncbi:MaoC/PaaZ C-terminal domain-containing protein [Nonomuraea sp. NPDC059007]|uniref:MaoC/PaaZ C-terminal domain-containing protein n=1 Tax=Nonomuraea sp. NPDC059007 TaxID=3346692 RepID=UPI00367EF0B6
MIPPLEREIDRAGMIAYAGATWDWHRLHHDSAYAADRGLPAPVVDGQLFGALLAEHLQDWLGPRARITRMSFRLRSMVFAGETVRCTGRVVAEQDGLLTVEQQVEVIGDNPRVAVAPATSVVKRRP